MIRSKRLNLGLRITLGVFLAHLLVCCSCGSNSSEKSIASEFGNLQNMSIRTNAGRLIPLKVEVADTEEERQKGLMFRTELQDGRGMLFVFVREGQGAFWMKNTPISLDLIFVKRNQIVDIIRQATPYSEELLMPKTTYTHVIEVPGGYAAKQRIEIGDQVALP